MTSILCPRCEQHRYTPYGVQTDRRELREHPYPALSRADNHTYICDRCGVDEALRDYRGAPMIPVAKWPIQRKET